MEWETQDSGISPDLTLSILWKVKSAPDKGLAFRGRLFLKIGTFTMTSSAFKRIISIFLELYIFVKRFRMFSYINGSSEGCVADFSQHVKFQKL